MTSPPLASGLPAKHPASAASSQADISLGAGRAAPSLQGIWNQFSTLSRISYTNPVPIATSTTSLPTRRHW